MRKPILKMCHDTRSSLPVLLAVLLRLSRLENSTHTAQNSSNNCPSKYYPQIWFSIKLDKIETVTCMPRPYKKWQYRRMT